MNRAGGLLTEEQRDYLTETMNIAAGNAAAALSMLLGSSVDIEIPAVLTLPESEVSGVVTRLGGPSLPTSCIRSRMFGDVAGEILLIVPDKHRPDLIEFISRAMPGGPGRRAGESDKEAFARSVMEETGNIMAGVYLTAVHDVTRLNIYHTVPEFADDMAQAVLDEFLSRIIRDGRAAIIIENIFVVQEKRIKVLCFIIPDAVSVRRLAESIEAAKKAYAPE